MTAAAFFTLRPLERNTPDNALEGAFRIHLSMKELKALKLYNGDPVRLSTSDGPKGYAVAWMASQTNPGNKPIAKVTDLLRETYGLSLNDRLFIEKTNDAFQPVESVHISFAESSETLSTYGSTERLLHCVCNTLGGVGLVTQIEMVHVLIEILEDLDMIFAGCTFEVQQGGPTARRTGKKIRGKVEAIESSAELGRPLYVDPITSRISIVNEVSIEKPATPAVEVLQMNADGIGGLSEHVASINEELADLTDPAYALADQRLIGPAAFLIHGPEGTGKSLLLKRLSECAWRETFRADSSTIPRAQAKELSEIFEKARGAQPSLVLMDNLDKFLSKAENLVAHLTAELEKLEGTKVVVAAAARSVYDIDASLRTRSAFNYEMEIFPPNVSQREDIFRQVIGPDRTLGDIRLKSLAERTHGFVGRDIDKLCGLARKYRRRSIRQSLGEERKTSFQETIQSQDFLTQGDFDAVIDQVQPTVLKDSILEVPKVRWDDIAGLGHVQELLEEIMIRPFKVPDLDIKFGGSQSRKGVLLYGPPGCAKTLIAQAVATESNQNFLAVKGSELIKMYVGESERAIRDVFRRARAAKPCIIFFDEIDSIGKSREKSQDSGLNVVTTLLNEMDGIEALKEVFIIGATNRPDILDSALIRTGRFDSLIHIALPNEDARRQVFKIHTRKKPLAEDVDLSILASSTEGSSGADIKGLCAVAIEMAKSDYLKDMTKDPMIRMSHFERALAKHIPHTLKEEAERYENWRPGKSLSAE